jgi:hypothetical protein
MGAPLGRGAVVAAAAITAALSGCIVGAPSPSPTPSIPAPVVCDKLNISRPEAIDCAKAVAVGIMALPRVHPPLLEIDFHRGIYCAMQTGCGLGQNLDLGFLVFRYADGTQQWVYVVTNRDGKAALGGTISTFPPKHAPGGLPTPLPSAREL